MRGVVQRLQASYREVTERVTWPEYRDVQASAKVVLITSLLFAMLVGGVDSLIERAMLFFYTLPR